MTKAKLKEAYQTVLRKAWDEHFHDDTLNNLQELCFRYGDGHKWCNYEMCLTAIIQGGDKKAIQAALTQYRIHSEREGAMNTMTDLAEKTNNFEI